MYLDLHTFISYQFLKLLEKNEQKFYEEKYG
jgi:hypothetical protein